MGSKTKIEWTDATWNPFMGSTDRVWIARRVGKKNAGAMLDGREWRQFPEAR
jgi:protein gp37